ncbi:MULTISPECIES: chaperone NapD [unclassified Candidatus Frackibacter]|uniref:chaperone NapD n=1 Tax=unclassified Candidatus Frackibacter TaxID=2648818 RepID=UPI000888271A|nr:MULTISPECIES: chaperone NapD [unclassified Candidatus Frackibacter]SDC40894.1 chaperone NapD for the signal peptide of nitrate reductase NapAB [Candidatus Frackibacter sp. WG11]SEM59960.1 chaperone NapD for the signal peptide of nitrate reductase NapAB [Candidatus Frackibacter sp. WG12]SFL62109.1 chaperone NapD for the signal peptide of nitrate reductase NapAB [Candidatus Frackibacter sp. WG13]
MLIAGALVEYEENLVKRVLNLLKNKEALTLYETEETGKVVVVIEAQNTNILEDKIKEIEDLDEVIGVFPSYINYEEEVFKNNDEMSLLN